MRLERLEPGSGQPALGALFGAVLAACAGLAAAWLRLGLPVPVCQLRARTGFPCPGCGSTRLIEALLSGDLAGAAGHNPLVFAVLLAVAIWAAASVAGLVLDLPPRRLVLTSRERIALRFAAVILLLAGWSYQVTRG